ncbi:MAG TPA: hypothetical protein VK670_01010 [Silvibacterium sp.]|nr:hypothetical protein [Silvibacterium sp.]
MRRSCALLRTWPCAATSILLAGFASVSLAAGTSGLALNAAVAAQASAASAEPGAGNGAQGDRAQVIGRGIAEPYSFSVGVTPASLTITPGGPPQTISVSTTIQFGLRGNVVVEISGLPSGVTASPSKFVAEPGSRPRTVTLTAATTAVAGPSSVTLTAKVGRRMDAATLDLTIEATASGIDVTTYHYDNARDGLNAHETILTPANVKYAGFGEIGHYGMDGHVDGAPLYLSALTIGGKVRNVLYAVSEHDSVYAFDADTGAQLWKTSVLRANETTSDNHGCDQITPEIGITSTPVIDRAYGAIFVVAMSKDSGGKYHHRLHALELVSGAELSGSPTEIQATYPGTGLFSDQGVQTFLPSQYAERVGLLLLNGVIYMGWTSHCDQAPYTGWLMGYSEKTLKQTSVLNLTPNSGGSGFGAGEGSIWMSGAGLAADASGNIYFLDANGGFDTTLNASGFPIHGDYGNAFMKVSTAGGKLTVADYFNPSNTVNESDDDEDLGSGGVLLLPDLKDSLGHVRELAVGAGKDRSIYVADRTNMGKFNASKNNVYQQLSGATANGVWGMPAWFNGTIYYGGQNDVLKAFSVVDARLLTTPSSQSSQVYSYPGATPSVSANGTQKGIVWAVENRANAGVLHAYDATNLAHELYNSTQAPKNRDAFTDNKFITPVVANGKVFVGTTTGVAVFGLLK